MILASPSGRKDTLEIHRVSRTTLLSAESNLQVKAGSSIGVPVLRYFGDSARRTSTVVADVRVPEAWHFVFRPRRLVAARARLTVNLVQYVVSGS